MENNCRQTLRGQSPEQVEFQGSIQFFSQAFERGEVTSQAEASRSDEQHRDRLAIHPLVAMPDPLKSSHIASKKLILAHIDSRVPG